MKYLPFLIFSLLFCACQKEHETTPNEIPPSSEFENHYSNFDYTLPEVVWMDVLREDSTDCLSLTPMLLENGDFITSVEQEIICYDGETGIRKWTWDDRIPGTTRFSYNKSRLIGKYLYLRSQRGIHKIDTETGQTAWGINPGGHGNTISNLDNSIFIDNAYGDLSYPDYSEILMINEVGETHKMFSYQREGNYSSGLKAPAVHIDETGDTILFFQNRAGLVSGGYHEKADFYAYNASTDEVLWYIDEIDSQISNIINAPIIDDYKIYFAGQSTMYCIDYFSGEILWEYRPNNSMLGAGYRIVDNKILIGLDNSSFVAVNKVTGNEIWKNNKARGSEFSTVSNGKIYLTYLGYIYIIDLETGSRLHKIKSAVPGGSFYKTIAVDEERGYMFSIDFYAAICMKIPE